MRYIRKKKKKKGEKKWACLEAKTSRQKPPQWMNLKKKKKMEK